MGDYTQLNLRGDVENMAERFGLAPDVEARFARGPLGLAGGGLSYQRYAPNVRAPTAHRHRAQEEVYVVVGGGGRVKLEDEVRELRQWDALRVAAGTARAFEAGPEGLELVAIGFGEGGDAEMLDDFWTE
ncbi:MAG TPA: cupin domain-containing protein [Gaiellaceae bacterium]|nr:cupin domain-containing protein [Gaiellaceae bacterium]